MHHPTDRITHTTAFVTPVVEHWLEKNCWVQRETKHSPFLVDVYIKKNKKKRTANAKLFEQHNVHLKNKTKVYWNRLRHTELKLPFIVLSELKKKRKKKSGMQSSSVVFVTLAMGRRIDPSWWTHWAISRSSQCSTTGVTNVVVSVILSVGWCI